MRSLKRVLFALALLPFLPAGFPAAVAADEPKAAAENSAEKPSTPPKDAASNPAVRALEAMQAARERLDSSDPGTGTRAAQQQAIDELNRLIQMAAEQSSAQRTRQPQQTGEPDGQPEQEREQQAEAQGTQAGSEPAGDAGESTDRRSTAQATDGRATQRSDLLMEIWGHLPPSVRQEIQNIENERYLPKYQDLVRRYYEALSEQGRQRSGR